MPAFIIGNGSSRKGFELAQLKAHGEVYGCNALYRDFTPDYLVAIDDAIIQEINESDFPKDRFIVPPEKEQYEDEAYNKFVRVRSNAGMNAMIEAIKRGHKELYCLGFDFMIRLPEYAIGNVYDGSSCYGIETRARYQDNINRVKYMDYFAKKYSDVLFTFVVPSLRDKYDYHTLKSKNVRGMTYSSLIKEVLHANVYV